MSERENDASSLTSPRPRITTRQEELGSNSLTNLKKYNIHRLAPIAFYPPAKARGFTAQLINFLVYPAGLEPATYRLKADYSTN